MKGNIMAQNETPIELTDITPTTKRFSVRLTRNTKIMVGVAVAAVAAGALALVIDSRKDDAEDAEVLEMFEQIVDAVEA